MGVLGEGMAGDILIERRNRRCNGVEFKIGVQGPVNRFMLYAGEEGGVVAVAFAFSSGTRAGAGVEANGVTAGMTPARV